LSAYAAVRSWRALAPSRARAQQASVTSPALLFAVDALRASN